MELILLIIKKYVALCSKGIKTQKYAFGVPFFLPNVLDREIVYDGLPLLLFLYEKQSTEIKFSKNNAHPKSRFWFHGELYIK